MTDIVYWWETLKKAKVEEVEMSLELVDYEITKPTLYNWFINGNLLIKSDESDFLYVPQIEVRVNIVATLRDTNVQTIKEYVFTSQDFIVRNGKLIGSVSFENMEILAGEYDISCSFSTNPIIRRYATPSGVGEIQVDNQGFNMAFVVDRTKDSARLTIFSTTQRKTIKPYSILYHNNTQTWWIVAKDKVERFANDVGYIYKHSLQLEGAIELLNARDLTDCGFNQKRYNVSQFTNRLFALSTYELKDELIINSGNNIDLDMNVDYIKTYENYTLLSALRDFYDGYNCSIKLNFEKNGGYELCGCSLIIIPKQGNTDLSVLDIDNDFNNISERRNIDKNSYGTTVISNTDNVVSTITKVYPSVGGAKLTSNSYKVENLNAIIRLPTKAFDVQEVKVHMNIRLGLRYNDGSWHYSYTDYGGYFNSSDVGSIKHALTTARTYMASHFMQFNNADFGKKYGSIVKMIQNMGTITIKSGAKYNPQTQLFEYPNNEPARLFRYTGGTSGDYFCQTVLCDKECGESIAALPSQQSDGGVYSRPSNTIVWQRGSEEISNLGMFPTYIRLIETDYKKDDCVLYSWTQNGNQYQLIVAAGERTSNYELYINQFGSNPNDPKALFSVKYIPMTDIKIKLDNNGFDNNAQLYNQNGKLTDINAFSKLINSYKREIEGENIVKMSVGYSLSSMPQIGQIVGGENIKYVINGASYTFYQNEQSDNGSYYIVGEYNLSESVSTKSMLTSPNTNIRDYGIPQKNNVARKQVYRDFYELSFNEDESADDNWYQQFSSIVNLSESTTTEYVPHNAIFKLTYEEEVNGSTEYYYTLESTVYKMKKAIYEVVQFRDNNIIGYDAQNISTGFSVNRVFSGTYEQMNVPISYVDSNGRFKSIEMCMCSPEQIEYIYSKYKSDEGYSSYDSIPYQNYLLFLPPEIYNIARASSRHDFMINELEYNKDALEVPVFEYCCQVDDTNDVEIGEDILESEDAILVIYDFVVANVNTINQLNAQKRFSALQYSGNSYQDDIYDSVILFESNQAEMNIQEDNKSIKIDLYNEQEIEFLFNSEKSALLLNDRTYGDKLTKEQLIGKDICIYKYLVSNVSYSSQQGANVDYNDKLVMIIHNAREENFDENGSLILKINHWRLE